MELMRELVPQKTRRKRHLPVQNLPDLPVAETVMTKPELVDEEE